MHKPGTNSLKHSYAIQHLTTGATLHMFQSNRSSSMFAESLNAQVHQLGQSVFPYSINPFSLLNKNDSRFLQLQVAFIAGSVASLCDHLSPLSSQQVSDLHNAILNVHNKHIRNTDFTVLLDELLLGTGSEHFRKIALSIQTILDCSKAPIFSGPYNFSTPALLNVYDTDSLYSHDAATQFAQHMLLFGLLSQISNGASDQKHVLFLSDSAIELTALWLQRMINYIPSNKIELIHLDL